jgi:hypothetical protein
VKFPLVTFSNCGLKMDKSICVCLLTTLLSGCLAAIPPANEPVAGVDYTYSVEDITPERRLVLRATSVSARELCFDDWPAIQFSVGTASLHAGDYYFAPRRRVYPEDADYCLGKGCYYPIRDGEQLVATVSYEEFNLPQSLYESEKELRYSPSAFWCDTLNSRIRFTSVRR